MIKSRTWKRIGPAKGEAVRAFLRPLGIEDKVVTGPGEVWRTRVENAIFTFWEKGTLYFGGGEGRLLEHTVGEISRLLHDDTATRDFLIGLDESGKGEILGPGVLAVVVIPASLLNDVEGIVNSAETKDTHPTEYWTRIRGELEALQSSGLSWDLELLPPQEIDDHNLNDLFDAGYERLLRRLPAVGNPGRCRITLDDYGVRGTLGPFLQTLRDQGAEVHTIKKADETFAEVRTAAVIARARRVDEIERIQAEYSLPEAPVGSGSPADPLTREWLRRWMATGKPWPECVRKSWKTLGRV